MGTIFGSLLLLLVGWWFIRAEKTPLSWAGLAIFLLGLLPMATLTSLHPYMLLAVGQSLVLPPVAPLGLALMIAGHLLAIRKKP